MTKKITKKDIEKIKKGSEEIHKANRLLMVVIFLIFLGFGMSIFFLYNTLNKETVETYTYNGFEFKKMGDIWFTQVRGVKGQLYDIPFYNDPKSLEDLYVEGKAVDILAHYQKYDGELYITLMPNLSSKVVLGTIEFARILGERYSMANIPTHSAFYEPPEDYDNQTPVVKCDIVTSKTGVIWMREGNETKVFTTENNCIIVQFKDDEDAVRVSDRFGYAMLGIMDVD
ncbi:hypothetical protein JXB41_01800 [Candidatus Woesearchaeota archaeon]|nr:hypothetical protein [Candidatus Woesearchaeota archaeon]